MALFHLSLKARLRLGTILLVTILVMVLAGLNLHRALEQTFSAVQQRALTNAAQIRDFLLDRIATRAAVATPRPRDFAETKQLWTNIIREDQQLSELLVKAVANSNLVADIYVADENLRILTASNPAHAGGIAPTLPEYLTFQKRPLLERILEIFSRPQDYVIALPLGEIGKDQEIFSIRIVTSSLLIAEAVRPELLSIGAVSATALGISILYTFLFSNLLLQPIARLGETIDRIAAGQFSADPLRSRPETPELAALEFKLGVLDQQVRGARQDALAMQGNVEQLLERMEAVVLLFDRSRRLLMAGRSAEKLLLRPVEELTGLSLSELFPAQTPIGDTLQAALQFDKSLTDVLVSHLTPAGEQRLLLLSLDSSGGRHLVSLRDAESRQQLASHLDLSARLAAINQITGGVAHEIKNPLNAIAIHLEVLRSRLQSDDPETQTEVEIITREISRLDKVVKGFLSFTRPVALTLEPVDLVPVLAQIAQLITPHAAAPGVQIVNLHDAPQAIALVDRELIRQALMNVTLNGIEAMPSGGTLLLRLLTSPAAVTVEISDQGSGIPDHLRQKIFELYFTTKPGGSGIGLATTFQAVQLMGGSINLTSQPGFGTTFRLAFHAAPQPLAEPAALAQEAQP